MDTTSTMVGMEPSSEQEEDPWSFLDNVPDFPIEKPCELNDLFDHTGFEDDIDFTFEAAAAVAHQDVVDVKMDGILDDISGFDETLKVVGVSRSLDNIIGQERLLSSSFFFFFCYFFSTFFYYNLGFLYLFCTPN